MPGTQNSLLTSAAKKLVLQLHGKWYGTQGICRCPAHDDRNPSLSVTIGIRAVLFHCFAGCTNDEVIAALARNRIQLAELFTCPASAPLPNIPQALSPDGNALRLWREAGPLKGSPAYRYLCQRSITTTSSELRFHPRTPFGPKGSVRFLPAMIAAVRSEVGIIAIHRTYIEQATALVVPLESPKRALGRLGTGAVRLGWPIDGRLGLAEGVENALSAAQLFGVPCWATLGSARFGTVAIPANVRELNLFLDPDHSGHLAESKAREVHRRPNRVIISHIPKIDGQDWNDVLCSSKK